MSCGGQISTLNCNLGLCIADLGYDIVLKKNKGYDITGLENKLVYLTNLKKMVSFIPSEKKFNTNTIRIEDCDNKIIPSPNNLILLTTETGCVSFDEECCFDECMINEKMSSICKLC